MYKKTPVMKENQECLQIQVGGVCVPFGRGYKVAWQNGKEGLSFSLSPPQPSNRPISIPYRKRLRTCSPVMNLDPWRCGKEIEFFKTNTPELLHIKGRVPAFLSFLERQHLSIQGGLPLLVPSSEFL